MKRRRAVSFFILILFSALFFYWQNNHITTTHYRFKNAKIDDSLNGYRIAQISDLHNKRFGKDQRKILYKLKKEDPDIIVITGDIVDSRRTDIDAALEFVEGASQIAPVYYVTGNHEFRLKAHDWHRLMEGLKRYDAALMDNRHSVMEGERGFYLIGLSDENLADSVLNELTAPLDADRMKVILAHEPQYLDDYSKEGIDLVFSGHAHGGQFRIPLIGGFIAPGQGLFPKYTSGAYRKDGTVMMVSRGLGNSIIPMRIFNRPEIVIVELEKE